MKILYGLPSEGMGHATRSKVIIEHLLQQHDVQIVTSDKAYVYLVNYFPTRVHQIEGFHLAFKQGKISIGKTFATNLEMAPSQVKSNIKKYIEVIKNFNPDLVISDFESFTNFYAKLHKKPLISIDNMQVIHRCKLDIEIPLTEKINYTLAKKIIQMKVPLAKHYFITSFFQPTISKKNTSYIPPIIRNEIINAKPTIGSHLVIYQTSMPMDELVSILNSFSTEKFIVYGFNTVDQVGNVSLKTFNESGFIDDFSSAKAVLANGGFSFLSEAVYLQKPIFSVPIPNQFEQFVNASYISKLGYGIHANTFSKNSIAMFLKSIPAYQSKLNQYKQLGNELTFQRLDEKITFFN